MIAIGSTRVVAGGNDPGAPHLDFEMWVLSTPE